MREENIFHLFTGFLSQLRAAAAAAVAAVAALSVTPLWEEAVRPEEGLHTNLNLHQVQLFQTSQVISRLNKERLTPPEVELADPQQEV